MQLERAATPEPQLLAPSVRLGFAALVALKQRQKVKCAAHTRTSRLEDYLTSPISSETDILSYWQSQEQDMPGLAQMAKDILAVPISGVGIERRFSTAQQICS